MNTYSTRKENTGSFNTFFCEGGASGAPAMIFLHGSGPGANSESNWRAILPALSDRYHVIALDFFGYGFTDHPETPEETPKNFQEWTAARLKQVVELMDFLKIEKATLVGNSMGGFISMNLVMEHPDRFEKVVLMGAPGGPAPRTPELARMGGFYRNPTLANLRNITKSFAYDDSSIGDDLDEILQKRYEMIMRPEIKRSYLSNMFADDPIDYEIPPSALKRMTIPFLLLHGMDDRLVAIESSISMMQSLPNAQLHLYTHCGHWIQVEKKDSFINKLTLFMEDQL